MKAKKDVVTKKQVLTALQAGPLRNIEIRAAIFGKGREETDRAGCATTEALQSLKKDHLVTLQGPRWALREHETCTACKGRGFVASKKPKIPRGADPHLFDMGVVLK